MSRSRRKLKQFRDVEYWQNRAIKQHLFRESDLCAICGLVIKTMKEATVDHIVPKSKGGPNTPQNLQLTHEKCNQMKGAV